MKLKVKYSTVFIYKEAGVKTCKRPSSVTGDSVEESRPLVFLEGKGSGWREYDSSSASCGNAPSPEL